MAASSTNPAVRQRALQAIASMDSSNAIKLMEIQQNQAQLLSLRDKQNLSPAEQIRLGIKDTGQQSKAYEELSKHELAQKSLVAIDKTLDEAFKINSIEGRLKEPIQSGNKLESMEVNLLATLKPIFNNLSESDKAQALANMPKLTDDRSTLQQKKNNMRKIIEAGTSTPILDAYGIKVQQSKAKNGTAIEGAPKRGK
jgi:hypothetical protein